MKRTPNLNLPQFEVEDKYRLEDYNEAYNVIDTEISSTNKKVEEIGQELDNVSVSLDTIENLKANKENITEIVNVLHLGFDNSGVDDITEKLQDIFNTKNNMTLYFPSGVYRINGNLSVNDNKTFKIIGENYKSVKFNCYATDGKVFNISATTLSNEIHVTFENISFINAGDSESLTCLYYYLCSGDIITKSCFLNNFYNNIEIYKSFTFQLYKTISINAKNNCLEVRGCNQFQIIDGQYTGGKAHNIRLYYCMCFNVNCDFSNYGTTPYGLRCVRCLGGVISGYWEGNPTSYGLEINECQSIVIQGINISRFYANTTLIRLVANKGVKITGVSVNQDDGDIVNNCTAIFCDKNNFETIIENCHFNNVATCIKLADSTRTTITNNSALPSKITEFINSSTSDDCIIDLNTVSNLFEKSTLPRLGTRKYNLINVKKEGATASRPTGFYVGQEYLDLERKKKMFWDGSKWWYFDGTAVN